VRAVDIGGHDADWDDSIDGKARANRLEPGSHVAGLAHYPDSISGIARLPVRRTRKQKPEQG
jgi:hypothetical protein